jgi:uncharacterized protein (TIGR00255 family)
MIRSMTGYAAASAVVGGLTAGVELRAVNGRFLDVSLRLSPAHPELEERVRAAIGRRLERGRIEVKIQVENPSAAAESIQVDLPRARAVAAALRQVAEELLPDSALGLDQLLAAGGILRNARAELDIAAYGLAIDTALVQACDGLDAMRRAEGEHIASDLSARLDRIEADLAEVTRTAADLVPLAQEKLKERIAVLTQGLAEIDPARIAQEAAFLADRSDISEEIVRAESHLRQFRGIMAGPEAAGRSLNFLLQELNREFNTMGSKVGSAAAAQIIVRVKSELEKVREQVQNVE